MLDIKLKIQNESTLCKIMSRNICNSILQNCLESSVLPKRARLQIVENKQEGKEKQ